MENFQKLYQKICAETERESLSDAEIHKIVLFLQSRLRQPGDAADLSIGQVVHVDPDTF